METVVEWREAMAPELKPAGVLPAHGALHCTWSTALKMVLMVLYMLLMALHMVLVLVLLLNPAPGQYL